MCSLHHPDIFGEILWNTLPGIANAYMALSPRVVEVWQCVMMLRIPPTYLYTPLKDECEWVM